MWLLVSAALAALIVTALSALLPARWTAIVSIVCGLILFLTGAVVIQPSPNPDPNHTHADFAVWINGRRVDFTKPEYMSGLSTDDHTHDEPAEYRHQHFHLHDGNGDVLHRHKPGLTLGEFFQSIGMSMTDQCFREPGADSVCSGSGGKVWRMFVNGLERPYDPGYVFADLDRLLLTYGSDDRDVLFQLGSLTSDACLFSKVCRWRPAPPAENCVADPEVPCVAP